MGKEQLEQLEKHGMYMSVPHGRSMYPMLRSQQDIVEVRRLGQPAKRYDLVLYVRGENRQGVLHRVLHVLEDKYIIAGDNCWRREYIPREQIKGIAVRFYRNGRWHEVTEKPYLLYVHLWTDLFFIRSPLFRLRDKAKAILSKIKKLF